VHTAAGRDADRFIAIRAAILPIPQPMQKAENCDGRVQDLLSSGPETDAHSGSLAIQSSSD
jgi:hypothetical protein